LYYNTWSLSTNLLFLGAMYTLEPPTLLRANLANADALSTSFVLSVLLLMKFPIIQHPLPCYNQQQLDYMLFHLCLELFSLILDPLQI
jgi:hypothetical protein